MQAGFMSLQYLRQMLQGGSTLLCSRSRRRVIREIWLHLDFPLNCHWSGTGVILFASHINFEASE